MFLLYLVVKIYKELKHIQCFLRKYTCGNCGEPQNPHFFAVSVCFQDSSCNFITVNILQVGGFSRLHPGYLPKCVCDFQALAGAAGVLLAGAERLRASQNELARNRTTPDFHIELLRLRQNWRLKKVSNSIIGDLSYRTGVFYYFELESLWNLFFFLMSCIFTDSRNRTQNGRSQFHCLHIKLSNLFLDSN